jgi:hypothetical protein
VKKLDSELKRKAVLCLTLGAIVGATAFFTFPANYGFPSSGDRLRALCLESSPSFMSGMSDGARQAARTQHAHNSISVTVTAKVSVTSSRCIAQKRSHGRVDVGGVSRMRTPGAGGATTTDTSQAFPATRSLILYPCPVRDRPPPLSPFTLHVPKTIMLNIIKRTPLFRPIPQQQPGGKPEKAKNAIKFARPNQDAKSGKSPRCRPVLPNLYLNHLAFHTSHFTLHTSSGASHGHRNRNRHR